jgi:hypothetical protein
VIPFDVAIAIGRLNKHARAYGCGKRAIYAYKALASGLAIIDGVATVMLRQWTGPCHGCAGTGKHLDSYGERFPHCRRCSSSGRVTLKFVEVALPSFTGQVWHHPFENGAGWDLAQLARAATWDGHRGRWVDEKGSDPVFWNITDGWSPKQPGERLEPDDAARLLNIVEAWALALPSPFGSEDPIRWLRLRATDMMRGYVLDLGRLDGPCYRCGSADVVVGLGHVGPPFDFATPACRTHERCPIAEWPSCLPESALTPALVEWRDRHVGLGFEREERHWG